MSHRAVHPKNRRPPAAASKPMHMLASKPPFARFVGTPASTIYWRAVSDAGGNSQPKFDKDERNTPNGLYHARAAYLKLCRRRPAGGLKEAPLFVSAHRWAFVPSCAYLLLARGERRTRETTT